MTATVSPDQDPLTPCDPTRGGGARPAPVMEIVTFRLTDGTDETAFLDAARGTKAILRNRQALVRRSLTRDDSGAWTDIVEWASLDEALAAAEAIVTSPDFAPFGAMIDGDTVTMRHIPILWQME